MSEEPNASGDAHAAIEPARVEVAPKSSVDTETPSRTGACPFCARKHLLKARGYAREVAERSGREWELDNLLENLLLAEDHAAALEDAALETAIRVVRHEAEDGAFGNLADDARRLYDDFKARYFPSKQ